MKESFKQKMQENKSHLTFKNTYFWVCLNMCGAFLTFCGSIRWPLMVMVMMMVMTIIKMMRVMIRMNLGSSGAWNGSASQKFHYIQLISFPSNALQCTLHFSKKFTTNGDTIIHFFTPMYLCALWDSSLRHKIVLVNIQLTNYSGWVGQYLGRYLGQ